MMVEVVGLSPTPATNFAHVSQRQRKWSKKPSSIGSNPIMGTNLNTEEEAYVKQLESRLAARHQWSQIWEQRALKAEKALAERLDAVCGPDCLDAKVERGQLRTQIKISQRELGKEQVVHAITKSALDLATAKLLDAADKITQLVSLAAGQIKINSCVHEWYRPAISEAICKHCYVSRKRI